MVLTRSGSPAGWYSVPLLANSPTSSFFLVSTLITGWPSATKAVAVSLR